MSERVFTRVEYQIGASIKYENNVVICVTENLCLKGVFLKTEHKIAIGTTVTITVYSAIESSLKFTAVVVREGNCGVAAEIRTLDAETFTRLREIISKESSDDGKVMLETYKMLECIS